MKGGKKIFVAMFLSFVAGVLNFLISVIRLPDPQIPWFLTSISGLATILAAILLYFDSRNRAIWGSLIFFYSNLGFAPFGISPEGPLLPNGIATLTLGMIGGALGIYESKAGSSETK